MHSKHNLAELTAALESVDALSRNPWASHELRVLAACMKTLAATVIAHERMSQRIAFPGRLQGLESVRGIAENFGGPEGPLIARTLGYVAELDGRLVLLERETEND